MADETAPEVLLAELIKQLQALTDPKERKAFFLKNPRLAQVYSAGNFPE